MSKVCLTDIAKLDGMSEWRILKFSDCIKQINTGLNPRKNFSLGHGKNRYITAKNLTKLGIIDFENCDCIDDRAKQIIHRRSDIQIGDILLSSRAPIGQCHLIKDEPSDYEIGESIFSIRVNKSIVRPDYFCLYLSSDFFVQLAAKNVTGSIIQEIRIGDLMNIDVIVPPMDVQEKIANSINMIDKKLILNNSICSDLESMAKFLYDYWFVQFEFPNEEGKPYKSSGGKMVWNEELKRDIPEGWEVGNLSNNSLTKIIKPGINKFEGTKNYLETADVTESSYTKGEEVTFENRASRANMQPTKNSVWFAKMKDSVKHLLLNEEMQPLIERSIFSTGFLGLQCSSEGFEYIATYIKSEYFEKVKNKLAHGATQQAINNTDLKGIRIVIPSDEVLTEFHNRSKSIYSLISKKNIENKELADMKDFLLPLLMNGQVTVGE